MYLVAVMDWSSRYVILGNSRTRWMAPSVWKLCSRHCKPESLICLIRTRGFSSRQRTIPPVWRMPAFASAWMAKVEHWTTSSSSDSGERSSTKTSILGVSYRASAGRWSRRLLPLLQPGASAPVVGPSHASRSALCRTRANMICYDSLITWSLIFSTASGLCSKTADFLLFPSPPKNLPSSMTRRPWPVDSNSTTLDRFRILSLTKARCREVAPRPGVKGEYGERTAVSPSEHKTKPWPISFSPYFHRSVVLTLGSTTTD